MKRSLAALLLLTAALPLAAGTTNISGWTPLYRGVDISLARVTPPFSGSERYQAVNCLRIDLTEPTVRLFTTPHCTNGCSLETLAENTSLFLERNGLQAAVNCNFYSTSAGPNDTPLGTPDNVYGLAISEGAVVSPQEADGHYLALLFASNNVPTFIRRNLPGTNTAGVYTAIGGNIVLVTNGVNAATNNLQDLDPRTAVGVSQDRRYLYLMTLDGRQPGWSEGANFFETARWLIQFGAHWGFNVDGGGSTTMAMADCSGKSVRLNRPSFVYQYGRERIIGHNFGVRAQPLPSALRNLTITPGPSTALIRWETDLPADTQVQFGTNANYGSFTPLDSRPLRQHVATLNGLAANTTYFFEARSFDGATLNTYACSFTTTGTVSRTVLFNVNATWKYTTNNLDGVNWKARNYNDSSWAGPGPGLLHVESSGNVNPKGTALPPGVGVTPISRTYYFRRPFVFNGTTSGLTLVFSNFIDDGAVFYLNGTELTRIRMTAAPAAISWSTFATGQPCGQGGGDATCADMFAISGNLLTNLVNGTNVLAVEVHNFSNASGDMAFGTALIAHQQIVSAPRLGVLLEGNYGTLFWNAAGFRLQRSTNPLSEASWVDVPGPVTQSTYIITDPGTGVYRLRN